MASNTHIRDSITTYDFVPLDTHLTMLPDGQLKLSNDLWTVSHWIPFGMGESDDAHSIIYHCRLGVSPTGSGANYRVSIDDGPWIENTFGGTLYYDESGEVFDTNHPTVYVKSQSYYWYLSYEQTRRTWYYELKSPDGRISTVAQSRSVPFWIGKAAGPYLAHGVYGSYNNLDLWGGYVDLTDAVTISNFGGIQRTYYGTVAMDREYHRNWLDLEAGGGKGPSSAMSLHDDEYNIDLALLESCNPIDGSSFFKDVPLEHQARINFYKKDQAFTFNDFRYSDDGGTPMALVHVEGPYQGGYIQLNATTIKTFRWTPHKVDVSWNPTPLTEYWGRTFVLWNGEITLNGETLEIKDAFGFGEFRRIQ